MKSDHTKEHIKSPAAKLHTPGVKRPAEVHATTAKPVVTPAPAKVSGGLGQLEKAVRDANKH